MTTRRSLLYKETVPTHSSYRTVRIIVYLIELHELRYHITVGEKKKKKKLASKK